MDSALYETSIRCHWPKKLIKTRPTSLMLTCLPYLCSDGPICYISVSKSSKRNSQPHIVGALSTISVVNCALTCNSTNKPYGKLFF